MSSFRRPSNTNVGDSVVYGGADLHVITDLLNGVIVGIPPVKLKSENLVSVWDGILRFADVADDTKFLTIKNTNGLSASRTLTIPNISVNDTIQVLNLAQSPINKTINLSNNTVTDTSAAAGEIVIHNGTKFVRLALGTNVQFLRGDGVWATAPGQGGGEANTGSNVGTDGVGIFKQKASLDLQFKKINAGSNKITITDDTGNDEVDIDVAQANLSLPSIGGTLTVAKGGTGVTTFTAGLLVGNGTSNITSVAAPSGTVLGTTDTQTITNKTINATNNTITDTSTAAGDILKGNGTKFVRLARGTAGQVLKVNAGGTDVEWGAAAGGGSGNTSTLSKNTTAVTVVSTASETDLLNFSITGGTIGTNGILHLLISGYYLNNSGGDETPQLRLKLGGTTIWQDSFGTITSASVRYPFKVEIYIKNNNSASQQRINGRATLGHPTAAAVGFSELDDDEVSADGPIQAESSIDTTTNKTIQFTVDHEDSSANISFVADIVFLELIAS